MFKEASDAIATFKDNLNPKDKNYIKAISTRNNLLKTNAEFILNSSEEKWVIENRLEQIDAQVKSRQRVVDLAEVLTNRREVENMIKLVNHSQYEKDKFINPEAYYLSFQPLSTWLEPAVGDGNFLVVLLSHKLSFNAYTFMFNDYKTKAKVDSGIENLQFDILKSISSLYAVDIDRSNVDKTRGRLKRMVTFFYKEVISELYSDRDSDFDETFINLMDSILQRNIILGNTIEDNPHEELNTHKMHVIEYKFNDEDKTISMRSFSYSELAEPEFTTGLNFKNEKLSMLTQNITHVAQVNKILSEEGLPTVPKDWKKSNGDTVTNEIKGEAAVKKEMEKQDAAVKRKAEALAQKRIEAEATISANETLF